MASGEIALVPIGPIDARLMAHLCAAVAAAFGRECRVRETLPMPDYAYDRRRAQYSAHAIVERLRAGEAERVLGVVDLDLFVPELNFVFGLADVVGRRAVIALPRLHPSFYGENEDEALFQERAAKEALHELGHTYGLQHCSKPRCVMHFSNWIGDTDFKQREFCQDCRKGIVHRTLRD